MNQGYYVVVFGTKPAKREAIATARSFGTSIACSIGPDDAEILRSKKTTTSSNIGRALSYYHAQLNEPLYRKLGVVFFYNGAYDTTNREMLDQILGKPSEIIDLSQMDKEQENANFEQNVQRELDKFLINKYE